MSSIEDCTDQTMRDIADNVKENVGDGFGFMVMVFPFGEDTRAAHYISNAKREDMIKTLREKADVLEAKLDIPSTGLAS